jgi:hypothetical protein
LRYDNLLMIGAMQNGRKMYPKVEHYRKVDLGLRTC